MNTELSSKSIPKIKKSASKIAKKHTKGFEKELVYALEFLMQKPKSWLAQSEVIKAIGITGSSDSVPYLLDLSHQEYDASIIYRDLAFSICMLTDIKDKKLSYFDNILNSYNHMSISGACSALLYSGFIPKNEDIINNKIKNNDFLANKLDKVLVSGKVFDAQTLLKSLYKKNDKLYYFI